MLNDLVQASDFKWTVIPELLKIIFSEPIFILTAGLTIYKTLKALFSK